MEGKKVRKTRVVMDNGVEIIFNSPPEVFGRCIVNDFGILLNRFDRYLTEDNTEIWMNPSHISFFVGMV